MSTSNRYRTQSATAGEGEREGEGEILDSGPPTGPDIDDRVQRAPTKLPGTRIYSKRMARATMNEIRTSI